MSHDQRATSHAFAQVLVLLALLVGLACVPVTKAQAAEAITQGVYEIRSAKTNKAIEAAGGAFAVSGTNAQMYSANTTVSQRWYIRKSGKHYAIVNVLSGNALTIEGSNTGKGANVQLATFTGNESQLWDFETASDGFTVKSVLSGMVLDVAGGSTANKANVQVWSSNKTIAQQWVLKDILPTLDDGDYRLRLGSNNSLVLDVPAGSIDNGARIQMWTWNRSAAQKWKVTYDKGTGYYRIISGNSGKALGLQGGSAAKGAGIEQYTYDGAAYQLWNITKADNGLYTIRSAYSGLVIGASEGISEKGRVVRAYANEQADHQTWKFTAVNPLESGLYVMSSALSPSTAIDVSGGSTSTSAKLQIWTSNDSLAQKWQVNLRDDGTYTIKNANSGLYLNDGDGTLNGSKEITSTSVWTATLSEHGGVSFRNAETGRAIDLSGAKTAKGTRINVYRYNGTAAQAWRFVSTVPIKDGTYILRNAADTTKVIDVASASTAKGADVRLWNSNGTNAQKWTLKSVGNGYFTITNANSKFVLDVRNGKFVANQPIQQWSSNGTKAQKWKASIGENGGIVFTSQAGDLVLGTKKGTVKKSGAVALNNPGAYASSAWSYAATTIVKPKTTKKATVTGTGSTSVTFKKSKSYKTSILNMAKKLKSDTNWMVIVDKGRGKVSVLNRSSKKSAWSIKKIFTGAITTGVTFSGEFKVIHKQPSFWVPGHKYYGKSYTRNQLYYINPYWVCYVHVEGYEDGTGTVDEGQGIHGGESSGGCVVLPNGTASNGRPFGDAEYIYRNVPVNSTIYLF